MTTSDEGARVERLTASDVPGPDAVGPPSGEPVERTSAGQDDAEGAEARGLTASDVPPPDEVAGAEDESGAGDGKRDGDGGPKLVRRVVCSYRLGWLPGDWLQTW